MSDAIGGSNESNFDLDTTGLTKEEIVQSIWGPGSNGIEIGSQWSDSEIPEYSTGGLNYSTQPGVVGASKSMA